jgi:hypothetical protein
MLEQTVRQTFYKYNSDFVPISTMLLWPYRHAGRMSLKGGRN